MMTLSVEKVIDGFFLVCDKFAASITHVNKVHVLPPVQRVLAEVSPRHPLTVAVGAAPGAAVVVGVDRVVVLLLIVLVFVTGGGRGGRRRAGGRGRRGGAAPGRMHFVCLLLLFFLKWFF